MYPRRAASYTAVRTVYSMSSSRAPGSSWSRWQPLVSLPLPISLFLLLCTSILCLSVFATLYWYSFILQLMLWCKIVKLLNVAKKKVAYTTLEKCGGIFLLMNGKLYSNTKFMVFTSLLPILTHTPFRSKKVQPASLFASLLPHAHPPSHPNWANYPKHISHLTQST